MPQEQIRAVFDCNVFWQIFFGTTIGSECWALVTGGRVELLISAAVLDEVAEVLTRPETQARFSKATPEAVEAFVDEMLEQATFIKSVKPHFQYPRDPKDEPYINLAVESEAHYIVSRDKDLLDLMTGRDSASKEFRQRFRPLKIVDTKEFVDTVKQIEN
ncbi:MAG: putative toxin-antitoxin system toxin component, PIN family [Pyrinomonadaceae bacterium]